MNWFDRTAVIRLSMQVEMIDRVWDGPVRRDVDPVQRFDVSLDYFWGSEQDALSWHLVESSYFPALSVLAFAGGVGVVLRRTNKHALMSVMGRRSGVKRYLEYANGLIDDRYDSRMEHYEVITEDLTETLRPHDPMLSEAIEDRVLELYIRHQTIEHWPSLRLPKTGPEEVYLKPWCLGSKTHLFLGGIYRSYESYASNESQWPDWNDFRSAIFRRQQLMADLNKKAPG